MKLVKLSNCLFVVLQPLVLFALAMVFPCSVCAAQSSSRREVSFSPDSVSLNNPTEPSSFASPASFSITFKARGPRGGKLRPHTQRPMTIKLYGVPANVITPTEATLTHGSSVTFNYNGGYFPNPITVQASMSDGLGGAALGVTQIVGQNRLPCTSFGSQSYQVPLQSTVPDVLKIMATVGHDDPAPADFKKFTIDTGSLGTVVPIDEISPADVTGPGPKGIVFYNSSGNTYSGQYYLAPVTIQLAGGETVQTHPIEVLAINKAYCSGPRKVQCQQHPPQPDLHYLGVGFARPAKTKGDLFKSPGQNPFLQLTDDNAGTDIAHGYTLSKSGVTLGVTSESAAGFDMVPLTPNPNVAGDWMTMPGCFAFPGLSSQQFCGALLLDVGIDEMFLDLLKNQRPSGSNEGGAVPKGTHVAIAAGDPNNPAMGYEFTAVKKGETPEGPAPTDVSWVNDANIFVNTGRRPLLSFDYLYDAQCGQTGFAPAQ
jgi:hypothetical protein